MSKSNSSPVAAPRSSWSKHVFARSVVAAVAALLAAPLAVRVARAADAPKAAETKPATTKAVAEKPADKSPDKKDAKKEEKKDEWKVLDGWKLEVLAEKPTIHHPSVLCPAPDGRIFVAEDPMDMKGSSKEPADRILVWHPDTKQFTVFAEGFYAIFGLQYIDGKLYVHNTPKFTVLTDKDSVGVDRTDLLDCTNPSPNVNGGGFNDHIPSNCRLAMDGYLYITTGDKGIYGAESKKDHTKAEIHGGGIIRMRPDGTDLSVYANGTRNHLDVAINAEDEMFTYDNTDDGLGWWSRFTHMVDGGYYGYPYDYRPPEADKEALAPWNKEKSSADKAREDWKKAVKDVPEEKRNAATEPSPAFASPYKPWTLWRMDETGGGSPTGSAAYNEDALPAEYHGNVFCSEWGKGQVERWIVERNGGTYKAIKHEVLLKGGPGPLRPVGIQVLPDGSGIVVCDWNFAGWRNANADAGRLLKLTYTGKLNTTPRPSWWVAAAQGQKFEASTADLIAALSHPAESVRLVAQRRLADILRRETANPQGGDARMTDTAARLINLVADKTAAKEARWHAIWTLDAAGDQGNLGRAVIVHVLEDSSDDRTVRMQAARQLGNRKVREAVSALVKALNEDDEALRFKAATALGRIGDVSAVGPLIERLGDHDLFTHYAIFKALRRIGTANPEAWQPIVAALASDRTEAREGVALAMHETYDAKLVELLGALIANPAKPADARAAAVAVIAPLQKQRKPWEPTEKDLKWWGTMPARNAPPPKEVEWAGTATVTAAVKAALNDASDVVRHAAVQGLKQAPDPSVSDKLAQLFESDKDVDTRKAILSALAASKSPAAVKFVGEVLSDLKANEPLFTRALEAAEQVGGADAAAALAKFVGTPASESGAKPEQIVAAEQAMAKVPDVKSLPVLVKRMTDENGQIVSAAAEAAGAINDEKTAEAVTPLLKEKRPEVRRAAVTALGNVKREKALQALLDVWRDKDVQKEAILALASHRSLKALDAYVEGLGSADGNVRNQCKRAIEQLHEKALPLIEARLDTDPPSARAVLEIQQAFERYVPADQRKEHKLYQFDTKALAPEAFLAYAKNHAGEAKNGGKVFRNENVGCVKCHKVGSEGGEVGPSLDGVGAKYPREFLIESILYPSKQILDGYQQVVIKRKSTNAVEYYLIRQETDAELTCVDSTGKKVTIPKDDVASRKVSNVSMMPEGLQAAMKPEEFADVVAYLESLKDAKK